MTDSAEQARSAMDALRRIVQALRVSSAASERAIGLSSAQLFALRQIAATPGASVGDVATRTRSSLSAVSEVVSRLVDRGLVERHTSPDDRRRAELRPTDEGADLLRRSSAAYTAQEDLLLGFARLTVEERKALVCGLEAWVDASHLAEVRPTLFFEADASNRGPA